MNTPETELAILEAYYTFEHPATADYRRRDILTLLNNWPGEIDRARRWRKQTCTTERPVNAPTADPNVCVIGKSRFTVDRPPRRDQWAAGPDGDSAFEAYSRHFSAWAERRNGEAS